MWWAGEACGGGGQGQQRIGYSKMKNWVGIVIGGASTSVHSCGGYEMMVVTGLMRLVNGKCLWASVC